MSLDLAPTSGLNIADMGMGRSNRQYRIHEFAALAGVTAKALRHYDRLGLLKHRRSASGYRLYAESDLERLEQIVALKFLGLPLKQIRRLLERRAPPIAEALRGQRAALEEKRQLLDRAITAIQDAERAMAPGTSPDTAILRRLIEAIERQNHLEAMKRYDNVDACTKLARTVRGRRCWDHGGNEKGRGRPPALANCAWGKRRWPGAMTFRTLIRPRLRRSPSALSSPT